MKNHELFLETYSRALEKLWDHIDYEYCRRTNQYTPETLAVKMFDAILKKQADKDSRAIKLTCKNLGIKHTYQDIYKFLEI